MSKLRLQNRTWPTTLLKASCNLLFFAHDMATRDKLRKSLKKNENKFQTTICTHGHIVSLFNPDNPPHQMTSIGPFAADTSKTSDMLSMPGAVSATSILSPCNADIKGER